MFLKLLQCRFSFADADRELMSASTLIDDTVRDYEYSGLVCNSSGERIDFEIVIGVLASK